MNENRLITFPMPGTILTALEAEGSRVRTREYGELIDFQSGCWAAVLGHSPLEIVEVLAENAGRLFHTHQFFNSEHPGAFVEELSAAAGLSCGYRGCFTTSGSEAVSLAVAMAEQITGREKKLSFSISYHGALPDLKLPRNPERWLDLDIRECLSCSKAEDCHECGKFRDIDFSELAAFVFEPGNSGGLVLCPPEKLVAFLCGRVRDAGGFVLVNEVTTGFGRTGKWFGFQHYQALTKPDFIAMGKGLGNGYPVSAVLVRTPVGDLVEATCYKYLQSHTDDPLGCSVARKVVEILARDDLVDQGRAAGEYLRERLLALTHGSKGIKEIRGRGLMNVAILRDNFKAAEVFRGLLARGIFAGYSDMHNFIHLYPPLIIQRTEIDSLCTALEDIFLDLTLVSQTEISAPGVARGQKE